VTPHDAVLDVNWMIAHTPQQYGLIESTDNEYSVMQLRIARHEIGLGRVGGVAGHVANHRLLNALGPPQEAEIAGSRVYLTRVAGDQSCVKVIGVIALVAVDREVAARVVRGLHPNLTQMRVTALPLGLGICDDYLHAGQQFTRLHQTQRVRAATLDQRHPIVA